MRAMLVEAGLDHAVVVDSAGTGSWHAGESADERARETLTARGYDGNGHVARQFDPAWFAERDLIVAMDGKNLQALRWLVPEGQEGKLARLRSFDPASRGGDLDIPDPYYGGPDGFDEVITLIEAGCAGLLDQVRSRLA